MESKETSGVEFVLEGLSNSQSTGLITIKKMEGRINGYSSKGYSPTKFMFIYTGVESKNTYLATAERANPTTREFPFKHRGRLPNQSFLVFYHTIRGTFRQLCGPWERIFPVFTCVEHVAIRRALPMVSAVSV